MPLEDIKNIPITAFAGAADKTCLPGTQETLMKRIASETKFVSIPEKDHIFPMLKLPDGLFEQIVAELDVSALEDDSA